MSLAVKQGPVAAPLPVRAEVRAADDVASAEVPRSARWARVAAPAAPPTVAVDAVRGLRHAPEGFLDAAKALASAVVEHPFLSLGAALGFAAAVVASPALGAAAVALGVASGLVITARAGVDAYKASSEAATAEDHEEAERAWGHAYGEAALNAGLNAVPLKVGGAARANAQRFAGAALKELDEARAAAGASPAAGGVGAPDAELARTLGELLAQYEPQALIEEVQALASSLPESSAKALSEVLAGPEFVRADPARKGAMLIEALGVVPVKLSQVMAQADGVPKVAADVLKLTQHELTPMHPEALERVLGTPLTGGGGAYAVGGEPYRLDRLLGVASIGEVHAATAASGERVVLKLRKPRATAENVRQEVAFLERLVDALAAQGRLDRAKLDAAREQLHQLGAGILDELDFGHEAANAARFQRLYGGQFGIVTMRHVDAERGILVMDHAPGTPFTKLGELAAPEQLAARRAYAKSIIEQVFGGYYHADPHAGNVFWDGVRARPHFIDAGAMASLTTQDKVKVAEQLLVLLSKNPEAMARYALRNARAVTSELPRAELEAKLTAGMAELLAAPTPDFYRLSRALDKLCEGLGVWPSSNGVWLNKTMLTVRNVAGAEIGKELTGFMVSHLAAAVVEVAVKAPGRSSVALANAASAIGQSPEQFAKSVVQLMKLEPERFERAPAELLKEAYAMAAVPLWSRASEGSSER